MAENKNQDPKKTGLEPRETFQGFFEFWRNLRKGFVEFLILLAILSGIALVAFIIYYIKTNPWEIIFTKVIWGLIIITSLYFSFVILASILSALVSRISEFINRLINPGDYPTLPEKEIIPQIPVKTPVLEVKTEIQEESRGDFYESVNHNNFPNVNYNFEPDMLEYAILTPNEKKLFPDSYIIKEKLSHYSEQDQKIIMDYFKSEEFKNHPIVLNAIEQFPKKQKERQETRNEIIKDLRKYEEKLEKEKWN